MRNRTYSKYNVFVFLLAVAIIVLFLTNSSGAQSAYQISKLLNAANNYTYNPSNAVLTTSNYPVDSRIYNAIFISVNKSSVANVHSSTTGSSNFSGSLTNLNAAMQTYNWAGFVIASNFITPSPLVTGVNGSWFVDSIPTTISNAAYGAQWIGIGGINSPPFFDSSLIQIGSQSNCLVAALGTCIASQYYLWYETIAQGQQNPHQTQLYGMVVGANDKIKASIYTTNILNTWVIYINDTAHLGDVYIQQLPFFSLKSTGEFIQERPQYNGQNATLLNFNKAYFGNTYTSTANTNYATINGITGPLGNFPYDNISMFTTNYRQLLAYVGPLSTGTSFVSLYANNFTIQNVTANAAKLDVGQPITLTAFATGGTPSYTKYNFTLRKHLLPTIVKSFVSGTNTITAYVSNTGQLDLNVSVTDSASVPATVSGTGAFATFTVKKQPTVLLTASNTMPKLGQPLIFTANIPSGGWGPFTTNLMLNGNIISTNTISVPSSTATFYYTPSSIGALSFNVIATDTGTTVPYVFNSLTTTLTIVLGYVPIALTNNQLTATQTGLQDLINVNSSVYNTFINPAWSNVEFTYNAPAGGTGNVILPAWVESGPSNTAYATSVFVKLSTSIAATSNSVIYMNFLASNVMSSSGPTGENPSISPAYGEYDDGPSVFNAFYDNFAGNTLNSMWNMDNSSGTAGTSNVLVNNGITFVTTGNGGSYGYGYSGVISTTGINSATYLEAHNTGASGGWNPVYCSVYVTSPFGVGELMQPYATSNGLFSVSYNWIQYSTYGGCHYVTTYYYNNENASISGGLVSNIDFARVGTGNPIGEEWISNTLSYYACGGDSFCPEYLNGVIIANAPATVYPSFGIMSPGGASTASFDWIRTRIPPPNNIMLGAIFGNAILR